MARAPSRDKPLENAQDLLEVDRVIHEPARLAIVAVLASCEAADFVFLRHATSMTQGNLSTHLRKLEEVGYISIEKRFQDNKPNTLCRLTQKGSMAFKQYRAQLTRLMK